MISHFRQRYKVGLWLTALFLIGTLSNFAVGQELFSDQFGDLGFDSSSDGEPVTFSADFEMKPGTQLGVMNLRAKIGSDWHLYSLTQKRAEAGGTAPLRSVIKVAESDQFKVLGRFKPDNPPHEYEKEGYDVPVEDFELSVVWSAPFELAEGVNPKEVKIDILFNGQTCFERPDGQIGMCKQLGNITKTAKFSGVNESLVIEPSDPIESDPGDATPNEPIQLTSPATPKVSLLDSPEEIAEMAELYKPEEKINYLLLSELESHPVGAGSKLSRRKETTIWTALLGTFFGGMLLNLMPCVFPVLGLKVMGFVEQAGSDPKKIRMHGIVFTLGVIVSMWILAGILMILKTILGQDFNWGAQMGNPYFVAGIIVLLFLLGLNMAGVFEMGTSLTRVGGKVHEKKGYLSSFLSGILTTLIATPCSGPFLGVAMTFTLDQPPAQAMFLFTIFALGIAFPYVVFSFSPGLISKLPRPGAWMHTFKVTMAFALFATVAFFMQTFGGQTGADGLSWLAMALVVIGLAAFFYGTWSLPHIKKTKRRTLGYVLPALIAVTGIWMVYDASNIRTETKLAHSAGGLPWQQWNPGKVETLLENKKKVVWVDYTASWCLTCKLNKKRIFSDSRVQKKLKELDVQFVVVDDTLREPRISKDLSRAERKIIPVNLVYPPNYPAEPAVMLDGFLGPKDALAALERMEKVLQQQDLKAKSNPQQTTRSRSQQDHRVSQKVDL